VHPGSIEAAAALAAALAVEPGDGA